MKIKIEDYYTILGTNKNSSFNEIKKAYRNKAKKLHPDKNKESNSHESFIKLTQAYDYLSQNFGVKKIENKYYDESLDRRRRAENISKMKYEAFIKSDFYKNDQAFLVILEHLHFFFSIILISASLIGLAFFNGKGFAVGLFISFCTVHFWAEIFKKRNRFDFKLLNTALVRVLKIKQTQLIIGIIINLILFISITIETVINTYYLLTGGIFFFLVFSIVLKKINIESVLKYKLKFIIIPLVFNLVFAMNYLFSDTQQIETYRFSHKLVDSANYHYRYNSEKLVKSTCIVLEENKYKNCHFLTFFYDYEKMKNKYEVTYTFENGLFGMKVLKSYRFN